jgi:hypothetical protein
MGSDEAAVAVTETKPYDIIDLEESGLKRLADTGRFQDSIVGVARDVIEGRNQFCRGVVWCVLEKEVRKVVEGSSLQTSVVMNRWGSWYEQLDGVGGATESDGRETVGGR